MELKIFMKNEKVYLQIPREYTQELSRYASLDIKKIKDGIYILYSKNDEDKGHDDRHTNGHDDKNNMKSDDKSVLNKLMRIKFTQRTVPNVAKIFSKDEITILNELIRNKFARIFKSKKYPEGVYSIDDSFFRYSSHTNKNTTREYSNATNIRDNKNNQEQIKSNKKAMGYKQSGGYSNGTLISKLKEQKYLEIDSDRDAKYLSYVLKRDKLDKKYVGIHGFDNRYYLVEKSLFKSLRLEVLSILNEQMGANDISKKLNKNLNLIKGVLTILLEEGEIIEKRKGTYVKV